MCGRYQFSAEENEAIREIIRQVQDQQRYSEMKTGEIYPTNVVPVLIAEGKETNPRLLSWGFPNFRNKGVIINARAETAPEKRMFSGPLKNHRCVIPTTGFFEWDGKKQKYLFRLPSEGIMYLAGLWNTFNGEEKFVILTTAPNPSIINVHNRMPVVLTPERMNQWIDSPETALEVLQKTPPMLVHKAV